MKSVVNVGAMVGLILVGALSASATVPPELPTQRTTEVFSPYDFQSGGSGENVFAASSFDTYGPACLQYQETFSYIQATPPNPFPSVTVDNFYTLLTTPAGIFFIATHTNLQAQAAVEPYYSLPFVLAKINYYQLRTPAAGQAPIMTGDLIPVSVDVGGSTTPIYGIAVTNSFINRVLTQHSLVDFYGCDSIVHANGPAGSTGGFIDSQHRTRVFVGNTAECPLSNTGFDLTSFIFGNMSGVRNDATGNFGNVAVSAAVVKAQSTVFNYATYRTDSFPNDPSNLRLYNAPRIVYSAVNQDSVGDGSFSNSLYSYPPTGSSLSSYPYNPDTASAFQNTDYPGPAGTSGYAKSGPVRINLRFSEPMDATWTGFQVQLRFSDGTTQDVTANGNWGTAILANDNWSATFSLPANPPSGKVVVAVRARKIQCEPDLDVSNQELDISGSGSSTAGTYDQTTNFPTGLWPFLDGESVSAVFGEARVIGPKFGSERLHGIRALGQEFVSYSGVGEGAEPSALDGTRFFRSGRRFYRLAAGRVQRLAKPSVRAALTRRPSNRFVNARLQDPDARKVMSQPSARALALSLAKAAAAVRRRAPHAHACDSSVSRREHSTSRPSGGRESVAVARAEGAQDRGDMKGRCEPRENIERRASDKIRAAIWRRLGPGVNLGARHVSIPCCCCWIVHVAL